MKKVRMAAPIPNQALGPVVAHSSARIDFLDHIRAFAILFVFLYHCARTAFGEHILGANLGFSKLVHFSIFELPLVPLDFGWVGVPMFFVVSGFCIHLSHIRSKEKGFKIFFIRRFFRIYPPYLIALLFFVFLLPTTRLSFHFSEDVGNFIWHLFLAHNFPLHDDFSINGSFWSIAIEMQLYLLYPVLLYIAQIKGWKSSLLLVLAVELTIICCSGYKQPSSWAQLLSRSPLVFWFDWSIGAAIAEDWAAGRKPILGRFPIWIGPFFFLFAYLVPLLRPFCFAIAALSTATILAYLLSNPAAATRIVNIPLSKYFRWIGLISYSIYLIHQPLLELLPSLITNISPGTVPTPRLIFILCLLETPFILFLSWAFYRLVEIPAIAWGKRVIQRGSLSSAIPRSSEAIRL